MRDSSRAQNPITAGKKYEYSNRSGTIANEAEEGPVPRFEYLECTKPEEKKKKKKEKKPRLPCGAN